MEQKAPRKLSQGVNYLGFLNAKLRDLRGWTTLANELIQNADDTPGATSIEFDVTDDALIVTNDGMFSDCGHADEPECAELDVAGKSKTCDFHAFRDVARGHKRQQEGTTGAFGIGFISVYQITDNPILKSGPWNWELHPENSEEERIHAWELDPPLEGTSFEFRWATASTDLRKRLGVQPVPDSVVNDFIAELKRALSAAAPFLKNLRYLRLKQNGVEILSAICDTSEDRSRISVNIGGSPQTWIRLEGDFTEEAAKLRHQFGSVIEDKRKSNITLAVPMEFVDEPGRYYAALPTEHEFDAPLLINADFFPSNDRKKVLFTNDYQGHWNRSAIRAASIALADNLLVLRDTLKPKDLWKLFLTLRNLKRNSDKGTQDDAMGELWNAIQPVIQTEKLVYTNKSEWQKGSEVRFLQSKEEDSLRPFLDYLNINVVHPDLRESATLLREKEVANVSYLGVNDIVKGMERTDLVNLVERNQIPKWLNNRSNRELLAEEFERLIEKAARDNRDELNNEIKRCAIALTTTGALAPPVLVRHATSNTRELFDYLRVGVLWLDSTNSPALNNWISTFSLIDAIIVLEKADVDVIKKLHKEHEAMFSRLLRWLLKACQSEFELDNALKVKLANLKIWPAGGVLRRLNEISVPGDFEDPLGLANLFDVDVTGNLTEVLVSELGASELTLQTYVIQHVPQAFDTDAKPAKVLRRKLVELLAKKIGELRDDPDCLNSISSCPIIECQNNEFFKARECYFKTEIVSEVLGKTVPLALLPDEHHESIRDLYDGLGVSSMPRASDIIQCVSDICTTPPNNKPVEQISKIFRGISTYWHEFEDKAHELEDLRDMCWLPGVGHNEWLKPSKVYAPYRQFLFSSQATFLAIRLGATQTADFFKFLKIPINPSVGQVVKHLIYLGNNDQEVKTEIYRFLNDNSDEEVIKQLTNEPCLHIGNGKHIRPNDAFWSSHQFGNYRTRLSEQWNDYRRLLNAIGVKDQPVAADSIPVLLEISDKFSKNNTRLDDENFNIVLSCWKLISDELEGYEEFESQIKNQKTIPDNKHLLTVPDWVFFEDKPRLAEKFKGALGDNVISKPEGAWKGMHLAGVRMLSQAVKMQMVECEDPRTSVHWQERIKSRRDLLARVFSDNPDLDIDLSRLDDISLMKVDALSVSYTVSAFGHDLSGVEEKEFAFWDTDSEQLYVVGETLKSAGALAREFAFALSADTRGSQLASGIKEVLIADTREDASQSLDDLGYPPAELYIEEVDMGDDVGVGENEGTNDGDIDENQWPLDDENLTEDEEHEVEETESKDGSSDVKGESTGSSGGSSKGGRSGSSSGRPNSRSPDNGPILPPSKRSRLRSYVGNGESAEEHEHPDRQKQRTVAENAGVDLAMRYEKKEGRAATEMPPFNEGYDIESRDENGDVVRYIEVKARTSEWDQLGVVLSAPEFKKAKDEKEKFWLYVVEQAGTEEEQLYIIQDPATKVTDYAFDEGWKSACDQVGKVRARSIRDLKHKLEEDKSSST